ncbi:preprotein translocase subunit SecG [Candidatus Jorgensenbacteria bacterium CG10_big_fil_rev_8_21_14_0_10_54_38]|uniref:Protein-export membrane protein SecG n=2 Tax=Candidatus Joergenseniibacteriota TaxID=1752739 RepID=A0A2M6WG25_9BACT|nr:MAG: preprotein translocase subunit SecG [Candidatus Jorgensenbacteria bacterium CG23_combo_of_CG06-09_8_20_14_all_54_14]PIT91732.1 MAG: preprotein translocase subunit SecG [Candidatus Jorgensenbacteria bacterium CG10_big_fil_rev_8_21_14_0_10_54_38]
MLIIAQIVVSLILIMLILLQERSAGLGGVFGGAGGTPYQTRRGLERAIFWGTIVAAVLFAALALANLFLTR